MKTHIGIMFPINFSLDNLNQQQLARFLLLNPILPVASAKKIINNTGLRSKLIF